MLGVAYIKYYKQISQYKAKGKTKYKNQYF